MPFRTRFRVGARRWINENTRTLAAIKKGQKAKLNVKLYLWRGRNVQQFKLFPIYFSLFSVGLISAGWRGQNYFNGKSQLIAGLVSAARSCDFFFEISSEKAVTSRNQIAIQKPVQMASRAVVNINWRRHMRYDFSPRQQAQVQRTAPTQPPKLNTGVAHTTSFAKESAVLTQKQPLFPFFTT